ncbi:MAG: hypothetical protein K8S16_11355 [Bacteroidales bacterium]|nr:hypothetical protein [Bacteroidales bacterium]
MKLKITNIVFLFCAFIFFETNAQTDNNPGTALKLGENYRIYPSDVTQTEVFITTSPIDKDILFTACNTLTFIPFFVSEGIYVTTDGGNSWSGNDTCTGEPISFHGGDPGITIDKNGRFIITRLGRSPFVGLYSHFSTDNGQTWSGQQVISTDDLERATLTTDENPGNSFYGRTYSAWIKFATPFPLMFSYTDDGAQSWSSPQPINNPTNRSAGGDLAIGPNGEIYACWAGVTETSPFKEILVGFAKSTTGGQNWEVVENVFTINGITGVLPSKGNIRVNGLPALAVDTNNGPRKGWIYIVTGEKNLSPAGNDPDIILHRSTDEGVTWSDGIRINQDELNNGKIQYFPSIHVDRFGAVNILFYDDRNTTTDSCGVFLARSKDGGDTWTEYEISDHNFKPVPIGGLGQGYQGDNIDVTSTDTKLWPVWMDNSSGTYQVWTSPIDLSWINNIDDSKHSNLSFGFKQNVPNPFQTTTTIGFTLSRKSKVSLEVFDIYGKKIIGLINDKLTAGYHEIKFDPSDYKIIYQQKNYVYICRLSCDGQTKSIRMIQME